MRKVNIFFFALWRVPVPFHTSIFCDLHVALYSPNRQKDLIVNMLIALLFRLHESSASDAVLA